MRIAILLLLLIATSGVALAGDPASKVGAELRVHPAQVVPGQSFDVFVVISYDREHFEKHAAPLFRQEMDLPLQITLPWLAKPEGARKVPLGTRDDAKQTTLSFVLNGEVVRATVFEEGSPPPSMTKLSLIRRFVATTGGPIKIPEPKLRYAHADTFEEDFLGERVPIEPRFIDVVGEDLTIEVGAFPAGAPEGFAGAVGTGAVSSAIDRESVEVGKTLRLTVRYSGAENLADLETPKPIGLEHFTVFGAKDDRAVPVRTVVYEIAPERADLSHVPSIRFPVFNAQAGNYVEALSKPIPIRVTGAAKKQSGAADADTSSTDGTPFWVNVLIGMFVGGAIVTYMNRKKRRHAAAAVVEAAAGPDAERVAAAAESLAKAANERTLAEYLGAQLGCSSSSVVGPGLAERLVTRGVSGDLARRTATAMEALTAARYGGGAAVLDPALVSELQAALALS